MLQGFAGLVGTPLSQALTVAQKISGGMIALFNAANGEVHLSWHVLMGLV